MRRHAPLLAVAALVVAGCGGGSQDARDKPKPVDPVKVAAAATEAKGTAKSTVKVTPHHLAVDTSLTGTGKVSLREPRAELTFDIGDLLGIAGVMTGTDLPVQVVGQAVYADPPDIPTVGIPEGWLKADIPALAGALDPGTQLRQLAAAGGFKGAGSEKIGDVDVRRYHSKEADVWVDAQHLVRRIRTVVALPAGTGTLDVTTDLSEYGTPFDTKPPQNATDVTSTVQGLLKG